MKKLIAVFALLAVLGLNSYASPFKLSLFGDIAVPQTEEANVVIGLIDNHTPTVKGVDLNFISARADELYGYQWSYIYNRATKLRGAHGAIYSTTEDGIGAQLGLVNNAVEMTGVQFGFVNIAQNLTGLQLAFVNYASNLDKGLQLGLLNICPNGWLPAMVIVNGRF